MHDERLSMRPEAVESIQSNLERGQPAIFASYGVIGAIMLMGLAGFLADRYIGTTPWGLVAGLAVGVCIAFYQLSGVIRR